MTSCMYTDLSKIIKLRSSNSSFSEHSFRIVWPLQCNWGLLNVPNKPIFALSCPCQQSMMYECTRMLYKDALILSMSYCLTTALPVLQTVVSFASGNCVLKYNPTITKYYKEMNYITLLLFLHKILMPSMITFAIITASAQSICNLSY
jgi:hypothetical protein